MHALPRSNAANRFSKSGKSGTFSSNCLFIPVHLRSSAANVPFLARPLVPSTHARQNKLIFYLSATSQQ